MLREQNQQLTQNSRNSRNTLPLPYLGLRKILASIRSPVRGSQSRKVYGLFLKKDGGGKILVFSELPFFLASPPCLFTHTAMFGNTSPRGLSRNNTKSLSNHSSAIICIHEIRLDFGSGVLNRQTRV